MSRRDDSADDIATDLASKTMHETPITSLQMQYEYDLQIWLPSWFQCIEIAHSIMSSSMPCFCNGHQCNSYCVETEDDI